MLPEMNQQWQQILQMTQQMQDLAVENEWEQVVEVEASRKCLLEGFFKTPISTNDAEEISRGLKQVIESDRQLTEIGVKTKQDLSAILNTLRSGRKAVDAYDRCR